MSDGMSQCDWCGFVVPEGKLTHVRWSKVRKTCKDLCAECFEDWEEDRSYNLFKNK